MFTQIINGIRKAFLFKLSIEPIIFFFYKILLGDGFLIKEDSKIIKKNRRGITVEK